MSMPVPPTTGTRRIRNRQLPPARRPQLCSHRFRVGRVRSGADAGAEHDLPDLALDHARAGGGIVLLGGVALGFVFYMLCAAFGVTALLFAAPYAYDALR